MLDATGLACCRQELEWKARTAVLVGYGPKTTTANLIPLVAPLAGVVVGREVVAGEVVDTAKALFVVPGIEAKEDPLAVYDLLNFGYIVGERTWFQGVALVPAGTGATAPV